MATDGYALRKEPPKPALARQPAEPARLHSLDAMRGFDMFWIIGGAELVRGIASLFDFPTFHSWLEINTEHPNWNGYTPWDQIFPMFMFIAGVAMPFSLTKRLERGDSKFSLYQHVIRRGLILVLFGAIYNGLLLFDFANARYPSVLGRIGLGYMFAGLIVLNTKPRGQFLTIVGILLGYYAALKWIPFPDYAAGDWEPGHTLGDYVDRLLIPGKLYEGVRDPEGLFSTIPSIATVLSGALAGHWLRSEKRSQSTKVAGLVIAGIVSVVLAILWSGVAIDRDSGLPIPIAINQEWAFWFPINKNLWTSSFVLYTSGWSLLVLSLFYLLIDVWGFKRWAFFFVVIGMNAITIYLAREFIDFDNIAHLIFRGTPEKSWSIDYRLLKDGGEVFVEWAFLYVLYRLGIFLRV